MGFIERLGYGVDRVLELMRNQRLREPDFTETGGSFRVILYNRRAGSDEGADETLMPRSPELVRLLSSYRDLALNPRQEAALTYLLQPENSRITNSELQSQFSDVHAETIRRDLADLVAKNILIKKGQKRGSYYVLQQDSRTDADAE
jgi:ATP-dependent DNA helicase RecG